MPSAARTSSTSSATSPEPYGTRQRRALTTLAGGDGLVALHVLQARAVDRRRRPDAAVVDQQQAIVLQGRREPGGQQRGARDVRAARPAGGEDDRADRAASRCRARGRAGTRSRSSGCSGRRGRAAPAPCRTGHRPACLRDSVLKSIEGVAATGAASANGTASAAEPTNTAATANREPSCHRIATPPTGSSPTGRHPGPIVPAGQ